MAEAADLKSAQCRFESDWGHQKALACPSQAAMTAISAGLTIREGTQGPAQRDTRNFTLGVRRRLLSTGRPLEVATKSSSGIAIVYTECGSSWIAPRRLKNSVCADSGSWRRPAEASNQAVVGAVPRRRAGPSCLSVSLVDFLHNDADGVGDAGIGPTYRLVNDISDLGAADSGALALLHREKQVIVSLSVAAIAIFNMEKSFADRPRGSGGVSPCCMAILCSLCRQGLCRQQHVTVVPRTPKLVSARQPKDCPVRGSARIVGDDDFAGSGEPT